MAVQMSPYFQVTDSLISNEYSHQNRYRSRFLCLKFDPFVPNVAPNHTKNLTE